MDYNAATTRQKQYIRNLGGKVTASLTKDEASALIDSLLWEEHESGKTFPCPYCKVRFSPRPSRDHQCPNCKQTIIVTLGKLFTQDQAKAASNKEWLRECQQDNRTNVREDAKDEREFEQEFGEKHQIGYIIRIGPHCSHVQDRNGLLVLLNDALHNPAWLPPYEGCDSETCECEYQAVSERDVPRGTRIVIADTPEASSIKVSRRQSNSSSSPGCAIAAVIALCLFLAGILLLVVLLIWAALAS